MPVGRVAVVIAVILGGPSMVRRRRAPVEQELLGPIGLSTSPFLGTHLLLRYPKTGVLVRPPPFRVGISV